MAGNRMKITDIHTHGLGGVDTRTSSSDDILGMARKHGEQGVSAIVPTIYSAPIESMRECMTAVYEAMRIQSGRGVGEGEAEIAGIHLEGPFLNPLRCGVLDTSSFIQPSEGEFEMLVDGFEDAVRIVTMAPELPGAEKIIRKIADMGIVVSMGHSDATYDEAERGFRAGAKSVTHIFNAMRPFHHREPGLAGFALTNRDIYIEVIADPFHIHGKVMEMIFPVKNHSRIIFISDSVNETGLADNDAGIMDNDGRLKGGAYSLAESANRLKAEGIDPSLIERSVTVNPRELIGLK
jgi:N-acetylglucosamine-6-phosphate deacetylase